ncbi:hypothetical protein G6F46_014124 [Rhizopus delemar]|nr:hypothetical protein G6F46_014124 [Rhizopus delemar]
MHRAAGPRLGATRSGALPGDDGDVPVDLQQGQFDILNPQAALLAHGRLEIGAGDLLATQHGVEQAAIARDHHRLSLHQALDPPVAGTDPAHPVVEQDQGRRQQQAAAQRGVSAQQGVLYGIAQQHDQQHVERPLRHRPPPRAG